MNEHEKSPAQGGEMPPVERAAITGSGGIDTVRGAKPADNAAQERNTNAAALDRDIAHLIDCSESGIARVPRETLVRLRALLTGPRAGLPRHVLASLECTAVWLEKGNDPQDAARELRACLAKIDAAPAAPVADPLRRRVERLLVELHAEGRLSEGQCAKMLDIPRIDWRELAEFLAPAAQAVAADGEATDQWVAKAQSEFVSALILAICELPDRSSPEGEPGAMVANSDEIAHCVDVALEKTGLSISRRAAVSPATADRICTLIPLSERHPVTDEHPRVIVFTDGSDFNGAQFFDVPADSINECFYESPDEQPEVCRHATHWMPRPSLHNAAPATADSRHVGDSQFESWYPSYIASAPVHVPIEQRCRDAYAAGMRDATPQPATADERAAFWAWFDSEWKREERDAGKITCGAWAWKTWKHLRASQAAAPADAISLLRKAHRTLACAALTQIRDGEAVWTEIGRFLDAAPAEAREQFQARVQPWMMECFGPTIAADRVERNHRFLEEALELVQSLGCTASEAHQLVDYTFGRPIGQPAQEVGGVMVTLAALCLANTLDMHAAGETELARISEPAMALKIRAKQAAKPKHSPLPQAVAARAPYEWRDTGPLETDEGGAA
ncbi:hypothetical protein [Burkholderia gladioli]|uniref:hypothetical protein n=1 Tax=Burkholderia gladioli TaxID=28095 RepID=UPI001FC7D9DF|nr:hypothetical protein [Burkholderia gladioli]